MENNTLIRYGRFTLAEDTFEVTGHRDSDTLKVWVRSPGGDEALVAQVFARDNERPRLVTALGWDEDRRTEVLIRATDAYQDWMTDQQAG